MAAQADPAWCSDERYARIGLSILGEPGDPVLGALMGAVSAAEVMRVVLTGADLGLIDLELFGEGLQASALRTSAVDRVVKRMRSRIAQLPSLKRLDVWQGLGLRLVGPGEPEWPSQLDDLGDGRPLVLWLRGAGDLRFACLRSAAVVGSRAATAYGSLVATELAADLAARSMTVISGGAYGIDACAHRGALSAGGSTIAVLASGLSFGYPKGHSELFATIGESGVMVSESPPDKAPNRPGFLVRNRLIAALSRGTVVVEAALRSGALNTARHAADLNRPVMAVPGPVTSLQSAGCHELIKDWGATCVTSATDVTELIAPLGESGPGAIGEPAVPAEYLDPVTADVLRCMSGRTGRGEATIATLAGVDLDTAMRCLGLLAASGYVERCEKGWRTRKLARESK
ncbi:MAG TPA: DNA-processing protein DprA [Streptosporangiaceae bacterium]|jgi:DNA processing protein